MLALNSVVMFLKPSIYEGYLFFALVSFYTLSTKNFTANLTGVATIFATCYPAFTMKIVVIIMSSATYRT